MIIADHNFRHLNNILKLKKHALKGHLLITSQMSFWLYELQLFVALCLIRFDNSFRFRVELQWCAERAMDQNRILNDFVDDGGPRSSARARRST